MPSSTPRSGRRRDRAIKTKHAHIVFRLKDAKRAKAYASRIEAGAKRALQVMPDPKGVDKIFYALTWPAIDGKLWGGVAVGDADAHAYYHPFLDPKELAPAVRRRWPATRGCRWPRAASDFTRDRSAGPTSRTSRVTRRSTCSAEQWRGGGGAPIWAIEGLATWGESPPSGLHGRVKGGGSGRRSGVSSPSR